MRWLGFVLAFLLAVPARAEEPVDRTLWEKIAQATADAQQMTYTLTKQERLRPTDAEMAPAEVFFVKFRKPYDVYMDVIGGPHTGRHILYRKGWDALKVHIFNRAFQWMVPKIWLYGDLALDGNHHPMNEAGFDHTIETIRENYKRNEQLRKEDPSHPAIQVDPVKETVEDGIPVYYFRSVNPEVFRDYTVTNFDHNVYELGKKVGNQGYVIQYYNSDKVRKWDDLHPGQKLRIPVYYAKMSEFWVDKKTLLITRMRMTDYGGKVYEEYRHQNIVVGPAAGLTDRDFDPANPDYGGF